MSDQVYVRRQWNSWRVGEVDFESLSGLHWSSTSGGVQARSPRPMLSGYVQCDEVRGDIDHSCRHGSGPHTIKVCITRKDNEKDVFAKLKAIAPR